MPVDVAEIVGQDNMAIGRKEQVIAILQNIPQPPSTKRFLYARWVKLLGYQPIAADIDRVATLQDHR